MSSIKSEDFRDWLISSYKLQRRSAGDVISRRNKLVSIIQDPKFMSIDQIEERLEEEFAMGEFSRSTLSGMVRAEKLYRKFKNS